jgi:hypothetical protein
MRRSVSEPRNGLIEAENVDADQKSFGLLPVSTGLDRVVGHYAIDRLSRSFGWVVSSPRAFAAGAKHLLARGYR